MAVAVVSGSEDWEDSAQGVGGDDDLHGCPLFGSGFDGVLLLALTFTVMVVMVVLDLECCRGGGRGGVGGGDVLWNESCPSGVTLA